MAKNWIFGSFPGKIAGPLENEDTPIDILAGGYVAADGTFHGSGATVLKTGTGQYEVVPSGEYTPVDVVVLYNPAPSADATVPSMRPSQGSANVFTMKTYALSVDAGNLTATAIDMAWSFLIVRNPAA